MKPNVSYFSDVQISNFDEFKGKAKIHNLIRKKVTNDVEICREKPRLCTIRPILISSWFTPFAYHLIKVPVGLFALTITPSAFHSIRKTHPFHKSLFFLVPFGLPSRISAPTVLTGYCFSFF